MCRVKIPPLEDLKETLFSFSLFFAQVQADHTFFSLFHFCISSCPSMRMSKQKLYLRHIHFIFSIFLKLVSRTVSPVGVPGPVSRGRKPVKTHLPLALPPALPASQPEVPTPAGKHRRCGVSPVFPKEEPEARPQGGVLTRRLNHLRSTTSGGPSPLRRRSGSIRGSSWMTELFAPTLSERRSSSAEETHSDACIPNPVLSVVSFGPRPEVTDATQIGR